MSELASNLDNPTSELVEKYAKNFREEYQAVEDGLKMLFERFPKNNNISEIIVKVAAVDAIYSTNIRKKYALTKIAEHIKSQDIDKDIAVGNLAVVEKIACAGEARVYSFATKYCHFHNPESYPIFDSFVKKVLLMYLKSHKFADFKGSEIQGSYSRFVEVLKEYKKKFNLNCTFKELDMFLWIYGKELSNRKTSQ